MPTGIKRHGAYSNFGGFPPFSAQYVYLQSLQNSPRPGMRNPALYAEAMAAFSRAAGSLEGDISSGQESEKAIAVQHLTAVVRSLRAKESLLLASLPAASGTAAETFADYLNLQRNLQLNPPHNDIRREMENDWKNSPEKNSELPKSVIKAVIKAISTASGDDLISVDGNGKVAANPKIFTSIREEVYKDVAKSLKKEGMKNLSADEKAAVMTGIDRMLRASGLATKGGRNFKKLVDVVERFSTYGSAVRYNEGKKILSQISADIANYETKVTTPLNLTQMVQGSFSATKKGGVSAPLIGQLQISIPQPDFDDYKEYEKEYDGFLNSQLLQMVNGELKGTFELQVMEQNYMDKFQAKTKVYRGYLPGFSNQIGELRLSSSFMENFAFLLKNAAGDAIGDGYAVDRVMSFLSSYALLTSFKDFTTEYANMYSSNKIYIFTAQGKYHSLADLLEEMIEDIVSDAFEKTKTMEGSVRLPNAWTAYQQNRENPLFSNWKGTQHDVANRIYIQTYMRG